MSRSFPSRFEGAFTPPELAARLRFYDEAYDDFIRQLEARGILFADRFEDVDEIARLRSRLMESGIEGWYRGASLRRGCISPACRDCVTALRSKTFELTTQCHRKCFFCLNSEAMGASDLGSSWRDDMDDLFVRGIQLDHVGLSGGEPLLLKQEAFEFFEHARERFPRAWLRLYTSGDLLSDGDLERFGACGLDEIRFSFKQEDSSEIGKRLFSRVAEAKRHLSFVAVEMPVFPGSFPYMRDLMETLAGLGVDSINLLEFCFPLANWGEFAKRGFRIANPPFDVLYRYDYAGGLPVAGSELECLRLLDFAQESDLGMGVHYCSLENKHRAEMFSLNAASTWLSDAYIFDEGDFFLKTCKIFGDEVLRARYLLDGIDAACIEHEAAGFIECHPDCKQMLDKEGIHAVISYNVLEQRDGRAVLRELALR